MWGGCDSAALGNTGKSHTIVHGTEWSTINHRGWGWGNGMAQNRGKN